MHLFEGVPELGSSTLGSTVCEVEDYGEETS